MKILMSTDGSESAQAAVDLLLRMPLPEDSEITLITVIEKELFSSTEQSGLNEEQRALIEQTKQLLQEEAEEALARAVQPLEAAGLACSTLISRGHPSREIVRAAKQLGAELVVLGSHGWSGVKRFLLGSVSDQVLAYAPCSVMIARPAKLSADGFGEDAFLRVLIAYDDSEPARQAVEFVRTLPLNEKTRISILSILPLINRYRQDIKQRLSWVWKEKKKLAQKSLDRLLAESAWSTPHVDIRLMEAPDVSQALLEAVAESATDLVVLGYKGKGAVEKFLLGSVTPRVAHHASCSVLAVRKCEQQSRADEA